LKTEEIVALMREHAALVNLEAEVVIALKAYQVGHEGLMQDQINKIIVSLQRIEDVRRRNERALDGGDTREES
jgi:hypothetical protein